MGASRRIERLSGLAWGVLLAMACGPGSGATPANVAHPIPLAAYFRDLRVVRAVAGSDTLTLLFDTGGGATLVTPDAARRLGCTPHGSDTGHRMTGEAVVFARCDSLRVRVGEWSSLLAPIGVFDVNALLPRELQRLDGVLALDAFRGSALTIDLVAERLTVHEGASADSAVRATGVVVRIATGESGRFFSALARVQGVRGALWFLLDSGNLRGTIVASTVLRDSLLPLTGPSEARLAIGGRPALMLPFSRDNLAIDGALGTDYFRRGAITLDLRHSAR